MGDERRHQRKPGRDGIWQEDPETTRARPADREWNAGWDRGEQCPPDPMKRRKGTRTLGRAPVGGLSRGSHWRQTWHDSRHVIRTMRRAGYVARHRWAKAPAETIQKGKT